MAGLCQHCGNRRIWYRRLSRNADTIMLPFSLHYIFILLLTCLAAFALTLLVCLFACRRKRNDRTRRGPMQRGATLPLPSRWPSTKGCSNTCGQPHWAPPPPTPYSWWWLCMRLRRSLPRSAGRSAARCSRCSEPSAASAQHHGVPATTRTSAGAPRHARRGTP